MATRLVERLSAARRRRFVGRGEELALFEAALGARDLPFCVLFVYGPGGVGKSTLLRQFAALAGQASVPTVAIRGHELEPSPQAFLDALGRALEIAPPATPLDALAARAGRQVILIDGYEALAPLDGWLRDDLLPELPDDALVVLAGRDPPGLEWRGDPGWQSLLRPLPLRNLSPAEGQDLLRERAVPPDQCAAVLAFTHGHPLALSLVADLFAQRPDIQFRPEGTPDIVRELLEHLVQKVPGPAHRAALEICALVRLTSEALLAEMLEVPDAHELFDWLRGLSFIEAGPLGLAPHDLAREALVADLRWRNPPWYAELHRRARDHYAARLARTRGVEQQRVLFDYVFLHRDNPAVRPFLEWQETGTTRPEPLREDDIPALVAMVRAHEGAAAADLARHWLARQPAGATIFRDGEGHPAGFVLGLALGPGQLSEADLARDPLVAAAWGHLARHAPLQPGERATLFRFWLARDDYQAVSATQSLIFGNVAQHYLTTPELAYSFFPVAAPDFWAPLFEHIDLARLPALDGLGAPGGGVFVHDWRVTPPLAWLALLAEREIGGGEGATPPPSAPVIVLSQEDFAAAVHDALRGYARPDGLRDSPLLRSRLVSNHGGEGERDAERAASLRDLLRESAEALQATPRDLKLYRALHHTYLHPAPTQEAAAEILDLPFSTYRRHLKEGVRRVAEALWRRDLDAGSR